MKTGETITKEEIRAIYTAVIDNSPKGSFWSGRSQLFSNKTLFEDYSFLNDKELERLCIDAYNAAEEHWDNLSAYMKELEAEIARKKPLHEELSRLNNNGPMTDDKFEALKAWCDEHGYCGDLYEKEFLLSYCRSLQQRPEIADTPAQITPAPMPPKSIRKAEDDGYFEYDENIEKFVNQKDSMQALVNALYYKYKDNMPTQPDILNWVVSKKGKAYGKQTINGAFQKVRKSTK